MSKKQGNASVERVFPEGESLRRRLGDVMWQGGALLELGLGFGDVRIEMALLVGEAEGRNDHQDEHCSSTPRHHRR